MQSVQIKDEWLYLVFLILKTKEVPARAVKYLSYNQQNIFTMFFRKLFFKIQHMHDDKGFFD